MRITITIVTLKYHLRVLYNNLCFETNSITYNKKGIIKYSNNNRTSKKRNIANDVVFFCFFFSFKYRHLNMRKGTKDLYYYTCIFLCN